MKAGTPFVSVIMPVYNGADFIAAAVASVWLQDYPALEVIIVDDGSTDDTPGIVASLPGDICYVSQMNSGPAAARNRGLEKARGDLIAFLDADDLWPTNKLTWQLPVLTDAPLVDLVMGLTQTMGASHDEENALALPPVFPPRLAFHLGSAVVRRCVFAQVGVFDESMRYSEDVDWFMRARECGVSFLVRPDIALFYRLHDRNMTRGKDAVDLNVMKALKRSLERRRQKPGSEATPLAKLSTYDTEVGHKR
jgi:glycosyltransferase involved in cell wall biosynthesis